MGTTLRMAVMLKNDVREYDDVLCNL